MPKTKKLSYAKRRERRNAAKQSLHTNENDSFKPREINSVDSQRVIEIHDDNVRPDVQDAARRNRAQIEACILDDRQELDDTCINAYLKVLTENTAFQPQDPLFYQGTHWYRRVEVNADIQIIYGGDIGINKIGHWTCVYYDGSVVHVYDTLHRKLLPLHLEILGCLYGEYSIVYEDIQRQPDGVSCGVFACAIATSLAQGTNPTSQLYFVDHNGQFRSTLTMRHHLMKILDQNTLIPFPTTGMRTSTCTNPQKTNVSVGIKSETSEPKKTYASVCRTVSKQQISLATQVASNDETHNKCFSAAEKKKLLKKEWWATHKEEVNETRRTNYSTKQAIRFSKIGEEYVVRPSVPQTQKRSKYEACADAMKYQKRAKYTAHPEIKKTYERSKYAANPEIKKNYEKAKYAEFPEIKKSYERAKYNMAPEMKKTHEKAKYVANPETKKIHERTKYNANPEIKKSHEKSKYIVNPEIKKVHERTKYNANPDIKKIHEKVKYAADSEFKKSYEKVKYAADSELKKDYERQKYATDPKIKKTINQKYYHARQENKSLRQKLVRSKNISKKYKSIGRRGNTITLLGSAERYIENLSSKISHKPNPESRLEAEKIIKWCIEARKRLVFSVNKTLTNLKNRVEVCTIRAAESSDIESKIAAFCGESKHTGSSEPYYADTAYNMMNIKVDSLITTSTGQVVNVLPLSRSTHVRKSWICSESCVKPDLNTIRRLEHLLQTVSFWKMTNIRNGLRQLNVCSVNKSSLRLGHSPGCYTDPMSCKSKLLPLQMLQCHFPQIRYFTRKIYELMRLVGNINYIDSALTRGDLKCLEDISNKTAKNAYVHHPCQYGISLNEDEIVTTHPHAFRALVQRSSDVPQSPCISCAKLCYRRDVCEVEKLRKPLSGSYWLELQAYIDDDSSRNTNVICHYCLDKFRQGQLPPTCILNQLAMNDTPAVISNLNDYEKILIQRAKAFQTVQRMGTVAKKNLPHKLRIQKLKGRTFRLPLPLEETLKKLPLPTDPLNVNQELFIMVCRIPSKTKVVWSSLVDVNKIYESLMWLKQNNPLYKEIELPAEPELLLESLTQDIEIQIEPQELHSEECEDLPLECNAKKAIGRKAILTQITDTEEYCEQFTIYPINADRENKSAAALYQMLKVQEPPLSNWDKCLDVMCFPDLYPYGNNGQHENRTVCLRECDFIKSRLMSKHSAFRLNQQYLFYLLHDSNIRQLKSGIFHKLNVINPKEKLHAERYLELMSKEQLQGNLTTIFARLRNTDQYWRKPRNDLGCMVQNYGPATWFLTLSPSEWMWEDLAEYIRRVNGPKMAHMSTSELVATDPVSASRYLDKKFQAMLKFVCSKDNPIGEVTHYFWRREYQGRGTQHFHLLIWIKDAPTIGESCTDEVIEFITKYITCRLPDKNLSPTLHRRVDTHQRHTHNDYCLRTKKNKTGFSKVCRFGFPRPITDSVVMRDVAVSIAGRKQLKSKSRLYDLPRSDKEAFINDYNPVILTAWEGNMDIQFIGEKSTILNWYCTRYTTKTEKSVSTEMFDNINSTKSLRSRLWSVASRGLDNRECGALEAADTLLGIPLYGSDPDTTIIWLDVNQIRNRKVKPHNVVTKLDPKSTDIFYASLIDDYYPSRPDELESLNLYDFAKWYDVEKITPVDSNIEIYELGNGSYLKKRPRGYLVNHYKYNVNVEPEKYFYALLLLFKPWRDTDELKSDGDSYAEAFEKCKKELIDALQYHERLADIQKGFDHVKEMIEKKLDELADKMSQLSQECNDNKDNPLGFQPVEADLAMQEFNNVDEQIAEVDVSDMISQLNSEQKRIFDSVTNAIIANDNNQILRLFVSGAGGTGKSFLIKTIRHWTKQILGKTTAVTAPTGLAAFNIDGLTVHRLLQLPIEHGGTPKYKELSDQLLKILRKELKDVIVFIIDEVSMISNVTLAYIHLRLFEIFDTKNTAEGWFGGKHIILFGDLLQLPPVNENSAFLNLSRDKVQKYLGSVGTINLWSHLFSYDELLINVRQQNDSIYQEILSRVRFGILTPDDQQVLGSRKIKLVSQSVNDRLEELCNFINKLPLDTVCLFSTRHQCDVLNTAMLAKIPSEEIELNAEDSVDCTPYLKKKISKLLNKESEDSSRTAGLAKAIIIKIGAKIMIRRNIDVSLGLINGTIGRVISVTRAPDLREVESLTISLASGMEYTIERVSTKFEIMAGAFIFRKQFPVSLSYGITIHKSQGLSLNSVVMDVANSLFTSGQAYVALSRVTSLEGLYLINLDPYSFKVQESALIEYNRLRKLYRPELAEINISHVPNLKVRDTVWSIPLYVCNMQTEVHSTALRDFSRNVIGIENTDGVSCYANATLQCIFHCESIIRELLKLNNNDPLETLAYSYVTGSARLDSLGVREFASEYFKQEVQQDAAEFLMALCQKSDVTRTAIEHKLSTITRCNDCGLGSVNTQPNHILTIPVTFASGVKVPQNLQDLIDSYLSRWTRVDNTCENCHKNNKLQKTVVASVKGIIILQLMIFSYKDSRATKITNFKLNAVPTTKVVLANQKFKVNSTIFHHGENLDSGHYGAMLKDEINNWLNVSDMQVRKMIWPRGAKNAYMFVLEKIP